VKIFLDLSESKVSKVLLLKNDKELDRIIGNSPLPLIDELLKRNNLKLTDLDKVESFPGPGSFTGLKVGATIANILNWQLGNNTIVKPIYETKDAGPLS
jgi:tRNA A37 threonylcarbamoyladenosine modification protein TsaB